MALYARRLFCLVLVAAAMLVAPRAHASAALELVAMARSHEAQHDDDVAIRRYTEALSLDPACEPAYVGLGALREKHGDVREADRVYSMALAHLPRSSDARLGRARVRWAMGFEELAARDMFELGAEDPRALRQLALWYMTAAKMPAALAVWRAVAEHPKTTDDLDLKREARAQIRALSLVVVTDPVAHPIDATGMRRTISRLASP
jgi:tetratricopeptide (TPR) repeat protein